MRGRGDEARVVAAFERFLIADGWRLDHEPSSWADVIAVRGSERLVAEAEGNTGANSSLVVDTTFGQLLRRMDDERVTDWALVVPTAVVPKVMRVPERGSCGGLGTEVYEVTDLDAVRRAWHPIRTPVSHLPRPACCDP